MGDNIGDYIDLGGKVPQFKTFAKIAYDALNLNQLVWIRIADPKAGILDDIQYATKTGVHAYQVKWSNKDDPTPFSYSNLLALLPDIISSWQTLRKEYAGENKPFFVHLLSNRGPSSHDSVKEKDGTRVESFSAFIEEVWMKLKNKSTIDTKWQKVADEFIALTGLDKKEFGEFVDAFQIDFYATDPDFGTVGSDISMRNKDLVDFTMFLFHKVPDRSRKVLFSADEIISQLNWQRRFQTTFNHELTVDPSRYCPIEETMQALNQKVDAVNGGYVFLVGGPGSGKSSLLTHWAKTRIEKVVRYYAFDFTDPASMSNTGGRGEAETLFSDLVMQLKEQGIWPSDTIPHKDKGFLKDTFAKQIELLKTEFKESAKRTIIVIDGLDHVPREHQSILQSFIAELPAPGIFQDGVIVVLGSQTYELKGLPQSVKTAFDKKDATVEMSMLSRKEMDWYIDHSKITLSLDEATREKLFEVSQGHPLYLSYLLNVIEETGSVKFLEKEVPLNGSIEEYYQRCWNPIKDDTKLVGFLGLVARLNGDIQIDFIDQWPFDDGVKKDFNKKTSFLFQKDGAGWHFFHNSFRQFLIAQTAVRPIDDTYDAARDRAFHSTLADYFKEYSNDTPWQRLYHLYLAGNEDAYIAEATQQTLFEQYAAFRPEVEIESDIFRGIHIAKKRHDPYLLARYIFALSELESRTQHIRPASFIQEFIGLGKMNLAKRLTRNNKVLLVNRQFALRSVHWFYEAGETVEAKIIFALAEPAELNLSGIRLQLMGHDRSEIKVLRRWASAAVLFLSVDGFVKAIEHIDFLDDKGEQLDDQKLRNCLLYEAGKTLIRHSRTADLEHILSELKEADFGYTRRLLSRVTTSAHEAGEDAQARVYLQRLQEVCATVTMEDSEKLGLANLVYTVTKNIETVAGMIKDIDPPAVVDYQQLDGDKDLGDFSDRVLYTKLRNLTGQEQTITEAVPATGNERQEPVIDFERKLCLIVKLYTDGAKGHSLIGDLSIRLSPIIRFFYYRDRRSDHNLYKLERGASTYFKLQIQSFSVYGVAKLNELLQLFVKEFHEFPQTWSTEIKRSILLAGYEQGADRDLIKAQLTDLETDMLDGLDPSSRVEQCHEQAKAWLALEEIERAEKCMHLALDGSLGIGYRKDSQYYTWVEWLQRILPLEPEHAERRIGMFALHLPVLRHTSERYLSREGAESLLGATLRHQIGWGFQLFSWLLDRGLIQLYAGVGEMIKALVRNCTTEDEVSLLIALYCDIYLLMATGYDEDVLVAILQQSHAVMSDFERTVVPQIIHSVRTNALPENRERYYQSIRTFLETKGLATASLAQVIDLKTIPVKITSTNSMVLGDNYKSMSEAEVLQQVTDGKSFIEIFTKEDKINSHFSWKAVFDQVGDSLSEEELREIFAHCHHGKRDSELLQQLTGKAMAKGLVSLAKEMAERGLDASSVSGWITGYDGGSRLAACRAIIATDKENGYNRSLEILADDVMEDNYTSEFHRSFDDILPVITESPDDRKIWPEIESFLSRLLTPEPGTKMPAFATATNEEVLADFVCLLSSFKNRGMHGITSRVVARYLPFFPLLQKRMKAYATGSRDEKRFLTDTLGISSHHDPHFTLQHFKEPLQQLIAGDNLFIRRDAIRILEKLDEDSIPAAAQKELPALYRLEIPVNRLIKQAQELPGDRVVKDTENLYALLETHSEWLDILVEKTGFSKGAILQRWGQLMESEGMDATGAAHEKKVREQIDNIELEFHFPRPRYEVIKRALGRILAELSDAGISGLEGTTARYDYFDQELMADLKVGVRPEWITSMQEKKKLFLSGWVGDISNSERLHPTADRTKDGFVVAGELTTLYNLSWGKPTETIVSYLLIGSEAPFATEEIPIESVLHATQAEYYDDLDINSAAYVVIRNDQSFRNPGQSAGWLAFNPILARQLGWQPCDKEMFGWQDANGELMAFSRFWRDGNTEMNPPKHDNEVGEGWYTLIAEKALAQLKAVDSPFFSIKRKIIREVRYEGYDTESFEQTIDEWE